MKHIALKVYQVLKTVFLTNVKTILNVFGVQHVTDGSQSRIIMYCHSWLTMTNFSKQWLVTHNGEYSNAVIGSSQWRMFLHRLWSQWRSFLYSNWWLYDDVIKWKYFPRYWPFLRGIHRPTVNSPHKGQCRGALMFSLVCAWMNGSVKNREAGDLRRHRAHYYVIVMSKWRTFLYQHWYLTMGNIPLPSPVAHNGDLSFTPLVAHNSDISFTVNGNSQWRHFLCSHRWGGWRIRFGVFQQLYG